TVSKTFASHQIAVGTNTSFTITITNPAANTIPLTGLSFTDNLPAGLVVATPSGLQNSCGGTATAAAGSGAVSLSGGSIAVGSGCVVSVNVTGTTAGVKTNSVTVTSTEGGASLAASDSVTVVGPPTISKAFASSPIAQNTNSNLTFTLNNP